MWIRETISLFIQRHQINCSLIFFFFRFILIWNDCIQSNSFIHYYIDGIFIKRRNNEWKYWPVFLIIKTIGLLQQTNNGTIILYQTVNTRSKLVKKMLYFAAITINQQKQCIIYFKIVNSLNTCKLVMRPSSFLIYHWLYSIVNIKLGHYHVT